MEGSDTYKKVAFILSTPELAELFFTAIGTFQGQKGKKYDPDCIVFNNHLEAIIYNSPNSKTVLYNRFCTTRNTTLLLFISDLLFEKSMSFKITLMDFRSPNRSLEEREISLYKALLDTKEFEKINITKEQGNYIMTTLMWLKVNNPSLLAGYESFSVNDLKSFNSLEYYHLTSGFIQETFSDHIIIIDFTNSFSVHYLYVKNLKRKVVVDISFGNTKGLETIITTSRNGFKLMNTLSDEKFKVYYKEVQK